MKLLLPRDTTQYNLGRTSTFRASTSALMGIYGGNLQNKEAHMRRLYIPDKGKVFCQPDQDGAEARIVAHLTEKGKYRELFDNDIKVHSFVSLHMFMDKWRNENKELDYTSLIATPINKLHSHPHWPSFNRLAKLSDTWPSQKRYYYLAKQTSHSANYGIRGPTFQMNVLEKSGGKIALSRKEADFFLSFYRMLFPEIPRWNYETAKILHATKTLHNLFGHPRVFTGREDSSSFDQEGYAFVPQSTVGELTHMAYRDTQEYIEINKKAWDLLVNTHDGKLSQLPYEDQDEYIKVSEEVFGRELTSPTGEKFRMKIEIKTGGIEWSFDFKECEQSFYEKAIRLFRTTSSEQCDRLLHTDKNKKCFCILRENRFYKSTEYFSNEEVQNLMKV